MANEQPRYFETFGCLIIIIVGIVFAVGALREHWRTQAEIEGLKPIVGGQDLFVNDIREHTPPVFGEKYFEDRNNPRRPGQLAVQRILEFTSSALGSRRPILSKAQFIDRLGTPAKSITGTEGRDVLAWDRPEGIGRYIKIVGTFDSTGLWLLTLYEQEMKGISPGYKCEVLTRQSAGLATILLPKSG